MQEVNIQAHIPHACADEVFASISDFSNYVIQCKPVLKITVEKVSEYVSLTSWEVEFHSGILKWQERDTFNPQTREIHFEQFAGDVDHFSGTWQVLPDGKDSIITFKSRFDLGLPMLADMLDPVAKTAIRDNINSIITGLFPTSYVRPQP
ncbi:SRPBCC family protein [Pseudomonas poae]|uniref:SRPBCC family protein n=1 Tax=Pseudomonas poae TaxID=200451 RepID=A0A7M1KPX1_9PSED|nr:SRPBCC family protein [Pseudomonas poae]QOQ77179.1 SRPBCC family protein [Pseudomonas poae]